MKKAKFATAINCIDGRVQLPVIEFIKNKYAVDYVDMITVPGPDKVLSKAGDLYEYKSIKDKVLFSYNNRDTKLIFIVSHHNCLGNPCDKKNHIRYLKKAVDNVKMWCPEGKVYGLWVTKERKVCLIKWS